MYRRKREAVLSQKPVTPQAPRLPCSGAFDIYHAVDGNLASIEWMKALPLAIALLLVAGCTPKTELSIVTHTVTVTASPTRPPGAALSTDGVFIVGHDIQPGTYRSAGPADPNNECNWERLSGLGGEPGDVIALMFSQGPQIVDIKPGDRAFSTKNCQPWTRI